MVGFFCVLQIQELYNKIVESNDFYKNYGKSFNNFNKVCESFDKLLDNLNDNLNGDDTEINIHQYHGKVWSLENMPLSIRNLIATESLAVGDIVDLEAKIAEIEATLNIIKTRVGL